MDHRRREEIAALSEDDVALWSQLCFPKYASCFREHNIDGYTLLLLTHEKLKEEMEILPYGARVSILGEINRNLRGESSTLRPRTVLRSVLQEVNKVSTNGSRTEPRKSTDMANALSVEAPLSADGSGSRFTAKRPFTAPNSRLRDSSPSHINDVDVENRMSPLPLHRQLFPSSSDTKHPAFVGVTLDNEKSVGGDAPDDSEMAAIVGHVIAGATTVKLVQNEDGNHQRQQNQQKEPKEHRRPSPTPPSNPPTPPSNPSTLPPSAPKPSREEEGKENSDSDGGRHTAAPTRTDPPVLKRTASTFVGNSGSPKIARDRRRQSIAISELDVSGATDRTASPAQSPSPTGGKLSPGFGTSESPARFADDSNSRAMQSRALHVLTADDDPLSKTQPHLGSKLWLDDGVPTPKVTIESIQNILNFNIDEKHVRSNTLPFDSVVHHIATCGLQAIAQSLSGTSQLSSAKEASCAVSIVDVSGFTLLTKSLADKHGYSGAEVLKNIMCRFFDKVLRILSKYGGDVIHFLGDAVLVQFSAPTLKESCCRSCMCSLELMSLDNWDYSEDIGDGDKLEDVEAGNDASEAEGAIDLTEEILPSEGDAPQQNKLRLHIAVSCGQTVQLIVDCKERLFLSVRGSAIGELGPGLTFAKSGEIILTSAVWKLVGEIFEATPKTEVYFNLEALGDEEAYHKIAPARDWARRREVWIDLSTNSEDSVRKFLPKPASDGHTAEFRVCSVLMMSIVPVNAPPNELLSAMKTLLEEITAVAQSHCGMVLKFADDDKGTSVFMCFGLPGGTSENNAAAAVSCAFHIVNLIQVDGRLRGVSIGIATGRVFCGNLGGATRHEYTVLGNAVNLAARLMVASKREILCDVTTYNATKKSVKFSRVLHSLKGFGDQSKVYKATAVTEQNLLGVPRGFLNSRSMRSFGSNSTHESITSIHGRGDELATLNAIVEELGDALKFARTPSMVSDRMLGPSPGPSSPKRFTALQPSNLTTSRLAELKVETAIPTVGSSPLAHAVRIASQDTTVGHDESLLETGFISGSSEEVSRYPSLQSNDSSDQNIEIRTGVKIEIDRASGGDENMGQWREVDSESESASRSAADTLSNKGLSPLGSRRTCEDDEDTGSGSAGDDKDFDSSDDDDDDEKRDAIDSDTDAGVRDTDHMSILSDSASADVEMSPGFPRRSARNPVLDRLQQSRQAQRGSAGTVGRLAGQPPRSPALDGIDVQSTHASQGSHAREYDDEGSLNSLAALVIQGPSGFGKSKLLQWFTTNLTQKAMGITLLQSINVVQGISDPFNVWKKPLGQLIRGVLDDRMGNATVMQLLSDSGVDDAKAVASTLSLTPSFGAKDAVDVEKWRMVTMIVTLIRYLVNLMTMKKVVFVFEDCHHMDKWSWSLCIEVFRSLRPRVMLVLSMRPPSADVSLLVDQDELVTLLKQSRVINLKPLSDDAIRSMVLRLFSDIKVNPAVVEAVVNKCNGNPFFATEIARSFVEKANVTGGTITTNDVELPESIQASVTSRIDALLDSQHNILKVASVLKVPFDSGMITSIFESDDSLRVAQDVIEIDLLELLDRGLLEADARVQEVNLEADREDDSLEPHALDLPTRSFSETFVLHSIVADAIYSSLSLSSRIKLHSLALAYWQTVSSNDSVDSAGHVAYHEKKIEEIRKL